MQLHVMFELYVSHFFLFTEEKVEALKPVEKSRSEENAKDLLASLAAKNKKDKHGR